MPATLALTNDKSIDNELAQANDADEKIDGQDFKSQRPAQSIAANATVQRSSIENASRVTKSAQKGTNMMSPYGSKTSQKAKDAARSYRMQTMTASKL